MSDVSIDVPKAVAEELQRRAKAEGKTAAELLSDVLNLPTQDPFEFVATFESDEISAANLDAHLTDLGFGSRSTP